MTGELKTLALADQLADAGRFAESATIYRMLITANPDQPGLRQNLATVLLSSGELEEAIAQCQAAVRLRPNYALALNTLGAALSRSGRHREAIQALNAALAADPRYAKAAFNLGQALDSDGRRAEALDAFRLAQALDPGLSAVNFELAALGVLPPPSKMPAECVLALFDAYAPRFDSHLSGLNYRVPTQLLQALCGGKSVSGAQQRFAAALDLGCGTGLVGAAFRPCVDRLVGIDLSPPMIAAADTRRVYDLLVLSDIVDYLTSPGATERFDLILAADVLIYLGDLQPLFAAVESRLNPGGRFAFSIEVSADRDYVLQPSRRYAHSMAYIRQLAAANGVVEVSSTSGELRRHGAAGILGVVFVLQLQK